jgi:hypothetical protein
VDDLLDVRALLRPDAPAAVGVVEHAGGADVGAVEDEDGVGVVRSKMRMASVYC